MSSHLTRSRLARAVALVAVAALGVTGLAAGASSAESRRPGPGVLKVSTTQPVADGRVTTGKSPSSALAQTPAGLTRIASPAPIPVMIKFDYDAVASYTGTVSGLDATSPSVTNRPVTANTAAISEYTGYIEDQEEAISDRIESAVPAADLGKGYQTVYGGVAAVVPGNSISALLAVPGVVAVQRDSLQQPLTDSSTDFINAPAAYSKLPGGRRDAGKGIILANIDTGVWPEHPSFRHNGNLSAPPGPARACEFGDNPLTPANDPFVCNRKLIGGQAFLDTYVTLNNDLVYPGTARDSGGHGSHTASTSAGNIVNNVDTLGPTISRINGVAPGAWVIEYKALGPQGGYASDLTAAVQQAIVDGADVINYSISGGSQPLTDPTELAFLDAYNAGVFVATSAGNSGPGAATTDHVAPWTTTVAASTQTRSFTSQLTLTASDSSTYQVEGASITAGAGPAPIVLASAAPYSDNLCAHPAPAGTFTGKIVVCQRGGNGRVEKGHNVLQGGAAGMILFNPIQADVETDNHWLPTVHVADGTAMNAFIAAHPGAITASFTAGQADTSMPDVMAAFSSRGPGGLFLKPDITGPGVQILAAMTPTPDDISAGPPGEYYQAIAGTSMSAPHIAGAAILLAALHPSWSPGQIKSAMMTQSLTNVVKENETTPADPFDMGAGRIDIGRADKAPLTISDNAANMFAYAGDPVHAIDLNIPSINAPTMPGSITTSRTLTNVTSQIVSVTTGATLPANTTMTFSPASFEIKPGQTKTVQITLTSSAPIGQQQFGTAFFNTAVGNLHLPVAFIHQQGNVSATQACAPSTINQSARSVCTISATNNDFKDQQLKFTTSVNNKLLITDTTAGTLSGGKVTVTRTLAGAELGVPDVVPAPDFFVDLALFVPTATAISDEELLNYNVPAFVYNGKVESRLGVDSNGYLVVGGGTATDNECCNLPAGPSPAAPNNILAPFWSDLDGTGAEGIRIVTLTDGVSSWIVTQWDVRDWGTNTNRQFQVWIGYSGAQDITFDYGLQPTAPVGQDYLIGAENEAGVGDMSTALPADSLRVVSTDPTPGDTFTYKVGVRSSKSGAGLGNVHTEIKAGNVPGTTVLDFPITVTSP